MVLLVLEQDAAVAVDDRLRQPRRAGGEEHVQRVRERDGREFQRSRLGEQVRPAVCVRQDVVHAAEVRDVDDAAQARKPLADRRHLLAPVDHLVSVAVAGDGEEEGRLELPRTLGVKTW